MGEPKSDELVARLEALIEDAFQAWNAMAFGLTGAMDSETKRLALIHDALVIARNKIQGGTK